MAASYATNPAAAPAPATRTKASSALAAVAGALLLGAVALLTRKPAGAWAPALAAETKPAFQDATTGAQVLTALLGVHREFGVGTKQKSSLRSWPFSCTNTAAQIARFPQLTVNTDGMLCKQKDGSVIEALQYPTTMKHALTKEASASRHGRCCEGTPGVFECVDQITKKGAKFPGCPLASVQAIHTRITTGKKKAGDDIATFQITVPTTDKTADNLDPATKDEKKEPVTIPVHMGITDQTDTGLVLSLTLPPAIAAFNPDKDTFKDPAASAEMLQQLGAMLSSFVESSVYEGSKVCGHGFTSLAASNKKAKGLVTRRAQVMLEALQCPVEAGIKTGEKSLAHFQANKPTPDSTACTGGDTPLACLLAGGVTVLMGDQANKPCDESHYFQPEHFCGDGVTDGCTVGISTYTSGA